MSRFKKFSELVRNARQTTPGIVFFYPLGIVLTAYISGILTFFMDLGGMDSTTGMMAFLCTCITVCIGGIWIQTLRTASKGKIWGKWQSFFWGMVVGAGVGIFTGVVLQLWVIPILLFFLFFLAAFYTAIVNYTVITIVVILLFAYYFRSSSRDEKTK